MFLKVNWMATGNHKEKFTGIQTMGLCFSAYIFFVIKTHYSCIAIPRSSSRAFHNKSTFYIKAHYKHERINPWSTCEHWGVCCGAGESGLPQEGAPDPEWLLLWRTAEQPQASTHPSPVNTWMASNRQGRAEATMSVFIIMEHLDFGTIMGS